MGRVLFGGAAIALGAACLALHAQLGASWTLPGATAFLYVTSLALGAGGIAMLVPRYARFGALVLGVVYAVFALTRVPTIIAHPLVYASWGNVFYSLGLVVGAMTVYGYGAPATALWGLCNVSFAIEQVEFMARTASLVPRWMPLGGMFWAILTTAAFALGGFSMLARYQAPLAARLLTVMLLLFGVLIWIPILIAQPGSHGNWSEGIQTFAIAGSAWIVANDVAARART